uniref:Uncharacterized protein n=1 Tax=Phytophthora ramorum TaxID=164328 RepID=H3GLT6_PHYRM
MPSDSEYEPGSDGDSDEHTDDYDCEEVVGDRAESPKDEGCNWRVYAEKESGEEVVDTKKYPGEDDAVVEKDAEAKKVPKTSGREDAEAETENATQVPEDVGTENTTRVPGDETSESGSELSAVPPPEKRYRPSKWSMEHEFMAASHKNISVTTEAFVAKRSATTFPL